MIPMFEEQGMKSIGVSCCEADDVIAICIRYQESHSDEENVIICSDKDLYQLISDKTTIINIGGEVKQLDEGMTSEKFLLQKILMGDNSDEISGIYPKVGPKTTLNLINNSGLLKAKLNDPVIKKNFLRNRKLIDFNYIPKILENEIVEKWETVNGE